MTQAARLRWRRPAVQRAVDLGKALRAGGKPDEAARKILFGQTAESVKGRRE